MLSSEIMDCLNALEDEFPVTTWSVGDLKVWPLVRMRLGFALFSLHHTSSLLPARRRSLLSRVFSRAGRAVRAAGNRVRVQLDGKNRQVGVCDAIFLSDGVSFTRIEGTWYERFCDPLIDILRRNGYESLLLTPLEGYHAPRRTASTYIQPELNRLKKRVSRQMVAGGQAYPVNLNGYAEVEQYLLERGWRAALPTRDELLAQTALIFEYAAYFDSLLTRLRPAVGFVVSYCEDLGMAFNLACRRHGIPSIDLQHGVQGELHRAYGRWKRVPQGGFELLPAYFWCWCAEDVAAIAAWSVDCADSHRPLVGRNLLLDLWRDADSGFGSLHDESILAVAARAGAKHHVLVTLQPGLSDEPTLRPLLQAMRDSGGDWLWWVRLHPCMLSHKEKIRTLLAGSGIRNFELDVATEQPLYAVLRHMDAHVTHSSSTVLEARDFGIASVVFSSYGLEFFMDLVKEGWVVGAGEGEVLAALLSPAVRQRRNQRGKSERSVPSDALQKVLAILSGRGPARVPERMQK